jgi:uncharacterized Tic20 family protein
VTVETETTGAAKGLSQDTTKWAMLCHLSALVGLLGNGIGFLIGPLIVWLIKKDQDPFIDEQGKEAVNFQITMFIGFIIAVVLSLALIGIPLLILLGIVEIVLPIIAAIKAGNGEHYRYPVAIRFLK